MQIFNFSKAINEQKKAMATETSYTLFIPIKRLKEIEVKTIIHRQRLCFYKEHSECEVSYLQKVIKCALETEAYQEYAKIEPNDLARNKFSLFVASDLLLTGNLPKQKYKKLVNYTPLPNIKSITSLTKMDIT